MQRQRCAVGLQTASGPVGHLAPVFAGCGKEFWRAKMALLNLADDAKDGAVAQRLAAQGRRHLHEESRAVSSGQRCSSA